MVTTLAYSLCVSPTTHCKKWNWAPNYHVSQVKSRAHVSERMWTWGWKLVISKYPPRWPHSPTKPFETLWKDINSRAELVGRPISMSTCFTGLPHITGYTTDDSACIKHVGFLANELLICNKGTARIMNKMTIWLYEDGNWRGDNWLESCIVPS